jgi:hypothetical protein
VFLVWQQHRLRLRRDSRRALLALCLSVACISTPAWAGTAYVDGVSDQGLASWAESLPPQIKLARYVVQWNVMRGTGYPEELANLRRWYYRAVELQLTPELALDNYNCNGCKPPLRSAEYLAALQTLQQAFPEMQVLEAWNEPNDSHYSSYLPPATAAQLMNAAYAFCSAHNCTAVAGDLLDSEPNMVEYEHAYERYLAPADPGNWAIHPYHAVKYMTDSTVASFQSALPSPATDHIWFTEVGAYYCQTGDTYGERSQAAHAQFLMDKLIPAFQVVHTFYYELAWGGDEPPACNAQQDDTALYAPATPGGQLSARAAAAVIFGAPPVLTASLEELFAA